MPEFIDTAEVARRLEMRPQHLLKIRTRLEQEAGFPLPIPHSRRPLRWRASAITAWIANLGRDEPIVLPFPADARHTAQLLELARRA